MIIEQTIIEYLAQALTVPVYAEQPENVPASFVLVEKTSGGKRDFIKSATLSIQSYASTLYTAAQLNEEVKDAVEQAGAELDDIYGVSLNSDINFTDPTTKRYRYMAVFNFTHR